MWQIISPNSSRNLEPIELKILKDQLANNCCKCKICLEHERSLITVIPQVNKETQINDMHSSERLKTYPRYINPENTLCPGCSLVLNLVQNRKPTILKDEESETNYVMFTSDKATDKKVRISEKTTSTTNKLSAKSSVVTFCDTITDYSTDMSVYPVTSLRRNNQVTFDEKQNDRRHEPFAGTCLCMENFINSIRPPLLDCTE